MSRTSRSSPMLRKMPPPPTVSSAFSTASSSAWAAIVLRMKIAFAVAVSGANV